MRCSDGPRRCPCHRSPAGVAAAISCRRHAGSCGEVTALVADATWLVRPGRVGCAVSAPRPPGQTAVDSYLRRQSFPLPYLAYLLTDDHHRAKGLVQATLIKVLPPGRPVASGGDRHAYVRTVTDA
jgi:hypothetical protein